MRPAGNDHGAADAEVGKFANAAGAGSVDDQVEKNLDQFDDDAATGEILKVPISTGTSLKSSS